ncbi:MAG: M2 family metallopeptidase [Candidatus Nomurabacteria bacterium]|nr:MAG: M2 family metallopeptidase [Candidatus Nomurabacteria bacterium]
MTKAEIFLNKVNDRLFKLHRNYERLFWVSYMGDHSVDEKKNKALNELDAFRGSEKLLAEAKLLQTEIKDKKLKARLQHWVDYLSQQQLSSEAKAIKEKVTKLESLITKKRAERVTGYIDPKTKTFVPASELKMRMMMRTDQEEKVRKACFAALEKLPFDCLDEYVEIVKLRNEFARTLGYSDFYDYKLKAEDKMTKTELFLLFDDIADKTKSVFADIRDMEKEIKGLRKPWNFSYLMAGDFTKEEDPYFQFDESLLRWGRSFAALGIDFKGGKLQLDLLDREGKWNNGFCHWPDLVHFKDGKRISGSANFTCNVVPGQVGSGVAGYNTLFHEGGHAAHLLNSEQQDVCFNHEYAPMTAAWAETHSMFIDRLFSSIEWRQRYAKDVNDNDYPFELFVRKVKKLGVLKPTKILSIIFVGNFEREVYELKNPSTKKIIEIAKKNYRKYYDHSEDSLWALNIPHIYAWDSACAYHGYGLAEIALSQWREYFYKKYGYIVDNPEVGKEMKKVWQLGSSKSFTECVKLATGKKLSSQAFIKAVTMSPEREIAEAKKRLRRMESVKPYTKPVDLKAEIKMVHGKKVIATNKVSFEAMAKKYGEWVKGMAKSEG